MRDDSMGTALLLQKARRGDEAAWRQIDERYRPILGQALANALRNRLGGRSDAEDLLQSTLFQAWNSLDGFHDDRPGRFTLWLHTLALNNLRDMLRRHSAQCRDRDRELKQGSTAVLSSQRAGEPTPLEQAERAEAYLRLIDALQELDEIPRAVVHLREVAQVEWTAIELALGLDGGQAREVHSRALSVLQRRLKTLRQG
jgi:RNA polymerase sigma-70 factor, ECF subfamily